MKRINLLSFIAATAVRQLPFDHGMDSEIEEDSFTLRALRCIVDGVIVWDYSGVGREIMSELKVYNRSEAMFFVGNNVFYIDGEFREMGDRSSELTVTEFSEMGTAPEGDEGLFEGARKWNESAKLAIEFDADWKGCTISGNGVVIAFQLEVVDDGYDEVDFVGGTLAGCTVDQQNVWPSSVSSEGLVSAWVRSGDKAVFFVGSLFRVKGTYTETNETSGVFSVTYFEERDKIPVGAEQMLSGAKRWAKGTQLKIKFTGTALVVRGRKVKFRVAVSNDVDQYLMEATKAALRKTYALQVVFSKLPGGKNPADTETLIKLDGETLFSTAVGGDRTTLLKLEEGDRVHVMRKLPNGREARCKFKVVKPQRQSGERSTVCSMRKLFVIFRSIPMEKYVGNEKQYAAWMEKYA